MCSIVCPPLFPKGGGGLLLLSVFRGVVAKNLDVGEVSIPPHAYVRVMAKAGKKAWCEVLTEAGRCPSAI